MPHDAILHECLGSFFLTTPVGRLIRNIKLTWIIRSYIRLKRTYETTKHHKVADSRCGRGTVRRTRSRPCFHSKHYQDSEGKPGCHPLSFREQGGVDCRCFRAPRRSSK